MRLTDCQNQALKTFRETKKNIFLTGHAGSGKTFLVQKIIRDYPRSTFPILASTGAAAVLVGGRTFHSFFGLGILQGGFHQTLKRCLQDRRLASRIKKLEGLILDEISMIPGQALNLAECITRQILGTDKAWGGLRILVVGDFAQLPPVTPKNLERDWAFQSEAWQQADFAPTLLKTMVRSQDAAFLKILNQVRVGQFNAEVESYLNARTIIDYDYPENCTFLLPRRQQVTKINRERLAELSTPLLEIKTQYEGHPISILQLKKSAPIPETLSLKKGALVMTRINDPKYRFINGSVGKLIDFDEEENEAIVSFPKKGEIAISKHTFEWLDAEGKVLATAKNLPLNLAYAMTIHKSQGTTLEKIFTDLQGLWEPGQAYVALSRLKSGRGLCLGGWDKNSFLIDPKVVNFHKTLEENSKSGIV